MDKYLLTLCLMLTTATVYAEFPSHKSLLQSFPAKVKQSEGAYSTAKSQGTYSIDRGGVVTVGKPKPKDKPQNFSEKIKQKQKKKPRQKTKKPQPRPKR